MLKGTLAGAAVSLAVATATASAATVSGTFMTPFFVDSDPAFYSFVVDESFQIGDVNITIDFTKCDDPLTSSVCVGLGSSDNGEIVLRLISPALTVVRLVTEGTYSGQTPGDRVAVAFDDAADVAVGGAKLMSGIFRPVDPLSTFNGERSAGVWSILYGDTAYGDPLAFNGFRLEVIPAPLPGTLLLLGLGVFALTLLRLRRVHS